MDFLPRRKGEATLQSEFYRQAKNKGLPIFCEYPSRWNESPGARFDCVIHAAGKIRALVEIKATANKSDRRISWPQTRQGKKYLSFNIPVFLVCDESDFSEIWEWSLSAGLLPPI